MAKVMFLQVSVCPQGGRVSASVHAGMPDPPWTRQTPPGPGRPPQTRQTPWTRQTPPQTRQTPPQTRQTTPSPGSRLQHTVYERPVRILLECILVSVVDLPSATKIGGRSQPGPFRFTTCAQVAATCGL